MLKRICISILAFTSIAIGLVGGITPLVAKQMPTSEVIAELSGKWQLNGFSCDAPMDNDSRPMIVKGRTFDRYESSCELKQPKVVNNTLRGVLVCMGEGETWNEDLSYDRRMLELSIGSHTYEQCLGRGGKNAVEKKQEEIIIRGKVNLGTLDSEIGGYSFITRSSVGDVIFEKCKMGDRCEVRALIREGFISKAISAIKIESVN